MAQPTAATPLSQLAVTWDPQSSLLARERTVVQLSGANQEMALGQGLGWGRLQTIPYSRQKLCHTGFNHTRLERS